jgi:hypothetical protein
MLPTNQPFWKSFAVGTPVVRTRNDETTSQGQALSNRLAKDCGLAQQLTKNLKSTPVNLSTCYGEQTIAKELDSNSFNILNGIKDVDELVDFVKEKIQQHADEKGIKLDTKDGEFTPRLQTLSSGDGKGKTSIYFSAHGKENDECHGYHLGAYVILKLSDAQISKIGPEVMGAIAKGFKLDTSLVESLTTKLTEVNKQNEQYKADKQQLHKQHEADQTKFETDKTKLETEIKQLRNELDQAKLMANSLPGKDNVIADLNDKLHGCQGSIQALEADYHNKLTVHDRAMSDLTTKHQKAISDLNAKHSKAISDLNTERNRTVSGLENKIEQIKLASQDELQKAGATTQNAEAKAEDLKQLTSYLIGKSKRSYFFTALAGLVATIGVIFTALKGKDLSDANSELEDANDDGNYQAQGDTSGNSAVDAQASQDRTDYNKLIADGTPESQQKADEIAARYTTDSQENVQFSSANLTPAGNEYMYGNEDGDKSGDNNSVYGKAYATGVNEAKQIAVDKAQNTVNDATKSLGLFGGMTGFALLTTAGLGMYTRDRNKHIKRTGDALNQALSTNSKFVAPKATGLAGVSDKFRDHQPTKLIVETNRFI